MGKEEVCNMDCLNCIHPECINENPMSRQLKHYYRNREKILAKQREAYRRKKAGNGLSSGMTERTCSEGCVREGKTEGLVVSDAKQRKAFRRKEKK